MANKTIFSLLVPISLVFLSFYTFAIVGYGGWNVLTNVKDPHVVAIGKFAVKEHNIQSKSELKFEKVIRGEIQLVAGKKYWLNVTANDGGVSKNYEAKVWEQPWLKSMNLTSFKLIDSNEKL